MQEGKHPSDEQLKIANGATNIIVFQQQKGAALSNPLSFHNLFLFIHAELLVQVVQRIYRASVDSNFKVEMIAAGPARRADSSYLLALSTCWPTETLILLLWA